MLFGDELLLLDPVHLAADLDEVGDLAPVEVGALIATSAVRLSAIQLLHHRGGEAVDIVVGQADDVEPPEPAM